MLTRLLPWLYAKLGAGRWLRNPLLERAYLALLFAYKRHVEDPFAALVARRPDLFKGGHVLDVGANIGYTATLFASVIDEGFHVYAFEPEPVNVRRLKSVIERNRLSSCVRLIEAAVGERSGKAELLVNPSHPGDHRVTADAIPGRTLTVPLRTLDDFVTSENATPVCFVKIDVQGLELAVSRGMEQLMARTPQLAVAFEFHGPSAQLYGYSAEDLIGFYRERGFTISILTRNGDMVEASIGTIEAIHRARGYVDLLATRGATT